MIHSTDFESEQVILNMAWVRLYLKNLAGVVSFDLAVGGLRRFINKQNVPQVAHTTYSNVKSRNRTS